MRFTGIGQFKGDERGVILIETLLVLPVLLITCFGILEFSNVMWQREQLQIGVRDAARYWSRCTANLPGGAYVATCNEVTARNIALYGNPAGTGQLRVPGWDAASEIVFTPSHGSLPTTPTAGDLVTVAGAVQYTGTPVTGFVFSNVITLRSTHSERYIGW